MHRTRIPHKLASSHRVPLTKWISTTRKEILRAVPNRLVSPIDPSKNYLFICGCGHSGTTLLASRIGNHPELFLIGRETGAFLPSRRLVCAKKQAEEWEYFASVLNKSTIIEKTPKHIHAIGLIKRVIPNANFLFITRNPLDNVASLYKRFGHLDAAIGRWINDNAAVARSCHRSETMLVKYEDLVSTPTHCFQKITGFAAVDWDPSILECDATAYDAVQHGDQNMRIRAEQVAAPIEAKLGQWRQMLNRKQAYRVSLKTREIAAQLGYSGEVDCFDTK